MQPRFHRRRSVVKSLRRIAVEQIIAALAAIADEKTSEAEKIHEVRQQLKRLRALIRLPHKRLAGYREENAALRDLGRRLARTRDADVLGETFDEVAQEAALKLPRLRADMTAAAGAGRNEVRDALLRGEIAAGLRLARRRVRHWRVQGRGFEAIAGGLARVYRDMRDMEARAMADPTPENFHEWRKQAKYHANQLALLRPVAPKIIKGYRKIADDLGTTLGKHHDLDGLIAALRRAEGASGDKEEALLAAIRRRNADLERRAFRLGDELTAERPDDFLRRIRSGWRRWRA